MATQDVEEYESDPEEVKRSLGMRRREASSDDEVQSGEKSTTDPRVAIHSDESDGQGGAADYDDDDDLDEFLEEGDEIYDDIDQERRQQGERMNDYQANGTGELTGPTMGVAEDNERTNVEQDVGEGMAPEAPEEEKKENEPYAVPTAGAFYMHDDRFRAKDNLPQSRRTQGGRRLWESKEDLKWGHDKFEEMNTHGRHYNEERRGPPKGRYRGRGKNRESERSYPRENRSRDFNHNDNQNQTPKSFRGRGPVRYDSNMKNSTQGPPPQNKQSRRPLEKTSRANSGRDFPPAKNTHTNQAPTTKQVFASSLSSASPPFYPSGSSNKGEALTQKRDIQSGGGGKNLRPSVSNVSYLAPQPNASLRGKNIVDSIGMDKLYINDSGTHRKAQGRGVATGGQVAVYRPIVPQIQANRLSSQSEFQPVKRNSTQNRVQSSVKAPSQQFVQRPASGSPPKTASSTNSYERGEIIESLSESSKSKGALVGKGKGNVQGNGRGTFMYGGTQVMGSTGNMAVGRGDQNFPSFLPVMQFGGGQHPGGIGVPALGMAFPGYVGGAGNSEMTWLPVLTGAGGPYSSYFAMDGAHNNPRPSGQSSSIGSSSKENNTNEPNNDRKSSQRSESLSAEIGHLQNKQPRRYSEMNFGQ